MAILERALADAQEQQHPKVPNTVKSTSSTQSAAKPAARKTVSAKSLPAAAKKPTPTTAKKTRTSRKSS
ncbi:hypothetical protein [Kitasatospora sp. NPDC050463]|uniref:hypothetical protein n=1 Tax=Kitasatospora sp. NPDC050463 TaxID=3155786 RepID=UPI0033EEE08F